MDQLMAADGAQPPDAPAAEDPAADEGGEEQGVVFAGQKFKSLKDAEVRFKSLQGQFKGLKAGAESAKTLKAQLDDALSAIGDWQAYTESLARGGQAGPKPASAGRSGADGLLKRADLAMARELYETKGPEYGFAYLLDTVEQHGIGPLLQRISELEGRFGKLEPTVEPIAASHAEMAEAGRAVDFLQEQAAMTDSAGREMYPELNDEDAVRAIYRLWNGRGVPPEVRYTPGGFRLAVLMYRDGVSRGEMPRSRGAEERAGQGANRAAAVQRAAEAPVRNVRSLTGTGTPGTEVRTSNGGSVLLQEIASRRSDRLNEWGIRP